MKVFISHSSSDSKIATEVCSYLEKNSHICFLAPRDIRSGFEYAEEIINGIDSCDAVLLLLSENSNSSPHVLREIERAVSKNISVVVFKLENVEVSKSLQYFLMTHQWINTEKTSDYSKILNCINTLSNNEPESCVFAENNTYNNKKSRVPLLILIILLFSVAVGVLTFVVLTSVSGNDKTESSLPALSDNLSVETESSVVTNSDESSEAIVNTIPLETSAVPENSEFDSEINDNSEVMLSDKILFGKYNNTPITWSVISVDNGKATLLTDDIICLKAFDAAEGGSYGYNGDEFVLDKIKDVDNNVQQIACGDNRWKSSNIRTWLNSEKVNVEYQDQPPSASAMSDMCNGYDTEPGFLNNFTDEELNAILTSTIVTDGVITQDKVYLLSEEELALLDKADVSRYALPTEAALKCEAEKYYAMFSNDLNVDDYIWWLRDADKENAYKTKYVSNSFYKGVVLTYMAGFEGWGVRPVLTIDLSSDSYTVIE